jgi:hypothetical protein
MVVLFSYITSLLTVTCRWRICLCTACTFDAANPRKVTCSLGTIPMGDTRTIAILCLADGSKLGTLSNVAVAGCDVAGQGTPDPKCKKPSAPANVTVRFPGGVIGCCYVYQQICGCKKACKLFCESCRD